MVCGAFAGWSGALELLFLSLLFAGLWGFLILIRGGKKDTEFPFIPFVLAAALAELLPPHLP